MIGFLPAVALSIPLQSRLEFGQSWLYALTATVVVTALLWLLLDDVFHFAWPVSLLGAAYPALRSTIPSL